MNNKGFTLIELLATIVILTLVISISTYSIIAIIKNAREKNYNLLIANIKDAGELYYQECKYANNSGITCSDDGRVTLGDLVKYGYLKGNSTDNNDKYAIVNPLDNSDISSCVIAVTYQNEMVVVTSVSGNSNCSFEYPDSAINSGMSRPSSPSIPSVSSRISDLIGDGDEVEPFTPGEEVVEPVIPVDPIVPVKPGDEVTK